MRTVDIDTHFHFQRAEYVRDRNSEIFDSEESVDNRRRPFCEAFELILFNIGPKLHWFDLFMISMMKNFDLLFEKPADSGLSRANLIITTDLKL